MSAAAGHGGPDAAARARAAARRQAPAVSGTLPALGGMAVVLFVMAAVILLDYTFDQDPHRILKVAIAVAAFGLILIVPKIGLLVLPVATPFLPWMPPTPLPGLNVLNLLLFSIFGTFAIGRMLQRRPLVPDNRLGGALALLVLVCALSVVRGAAFPTGYGFEGGVAGINVFRSATTFATYFIVLAMATGPADRGRVWWAVMIGLLVEAVVTLIYGRNGSGGRALGSIGQSNDLGAFLAMFAVPALAGVFGVKNAFGRVLLLGIFVVACMGVMLSLSRGSMLALVAGTLLVAWLSSRWALGVLVAALLFSPLWAPDYLKERITASSVEVEGSDEMAVDPAAEARLQTWQSILQVVAEHPIEGVGFTGLAYVLPEVGEGLGLEEVKESAHNTWLRMLSETGIIGLAVFTWLMWKCWSIGWQAMRRSRVAFDRALGVGLCGATLTLAINCAFGDRFFNVVIAGNFWILCALTEDALAAGAPAAAKEAA